MIVAPFTFDRSGAVYVCADGPELVTYSGANDVPIWKQFCEGILVGVAASGDHVVSVDTDGHMIWWRKIDGAQMRDALLDLPINQLVTGPDGTLAAVGPKGVAIVSPMGDHNLLEYEGACAAAFGVGTVAIGFDNGVIEVREIGSGAELGVIEVHAKVTGIAWSALGMYLIAAGNQLHLVNQQEVPPPPPPPGVDPKTYEPPPPEKRWALAQTLEMGAPVAHLSASNDGILAAITAGPHEVVVLELHNKAVVGKVVVGREVTGVCFGPMSWVGIGVDDAGASRVDLVSGNMARVQPGLGRMPTAWTTEVNVNYAAVRGALALSKAGGQDIARRIEWGGYLSEMAGASPEGGGGWGMTCGIGCLLLALSCGCCSCSGTLYSYLM